MLKLIYTLTFTSLVQILPSRPMTYEVVDKGTFYCYWHLKYELKK